MARKKRARAAKTKVKRTAAKRKPVARRKPTRKKPRRPRPRKTLNPVDRQVLTLGIYGGDPTSGQIATPPSSA